MSDLNKVDVLFVGGGPASLAGAIKLKQLLKEEDRNASIVIIEKAAKSGQHNLSGAVFEPWVLDKLIPDWKDSQDKFVTGMLANQVLHDEVVLLWEAKRASKIPGKLVPRSMHHRDNYIISVSEMVTWLASIATELGVEIYNGFAAKEMVIENSCVKGVRLGEKGLDKERNKLPNYIPGETLEAKVTVLGEGSAGQLAEDLGRKLNTSGGSNRQIYSLGVKEVIRLPYGNKFGNNHVVHTLGYPLPSDVFGGGALYSMGNNLIAVALIMSLDWRYCNLDPHHELQVFKSHPYINSIIRDGRVIAYGAKTLPEGGYYSLPKLFADGALIIGDDAGLTNVQKLKGLHYAIQSGILAGETIFDAIKAQDFSERTLKCYRNKLDKSFIMKELWEGRNYRQVFARYGMIWGIPISFCQKLLPRLGGKPDYSRTRRVQLKRKDTGGTDRLTGVSLSGTLHREDQPTHITFMEEGNDSSCYQKYGCHPCAYFCPAEVYKFIDDKLILSPSNCLHCQTCRLKCPNQVIKWEIPEGGDGPRYKLM